MQFDLMCHIALPKPFPTILQQLNNRGNVEFIAETTAKFETGKWTDTSVYTGYLLSEMDTIFSGAFKNGKNSFVSGIGSSEPEYTEKLQGQYKRQLIQAVHNHKFKGLTLMELKARRDIMASRIEFLYGMGKEFHPQLPLMTVKCVQAFMTIFKRTSNSLREVSTQ